MTTTSNASEQPVLITEAPVSLSQQYARRQRRYAILMGLRFPCLLLAGIFYHIWWLALIFLVLSVPLPWMAVLIANDRPPRKAENPHRVSNQNGPQQLEGTSTEPGRQSH